MDSEWQQGIGRGECELKSRAWDSHQRDVSLNQALGTDSHDSDKEDIKMRLRDSYSFPMPCVLASVSWMLIHRSWWGDSYSEACSQTDIYLRGQEPEWRSWPVWDPPWGTEGYGGQTHAIITQWSRIPNCSSGVVVKLVTLELDYCHSNFTS